MAMAIIGAIFGGIVAGTIGGGIGWAILGVVLGGLMGLGTVAKQDEEKRHKDEVEKLLKDIKDNKKDN